MKNLTGCPTHAQLGWERVTNYSGYPVKWECIDSNLEPRPSNLAAVTLHKLS